MRKEIRERIEKARAAGIEGSPRSTEVKAITFLGQAEERIAQQLSEARNSKLKVKSQLKGMVGKEVTERMNRVRAKESERRKVMRKELKSSIYSGVKRHVEQPLLAEIENLRSAHQELRDLVAPLRDRLVAEGKEQHD